MNKNNRALLPRKPNANLNSKITGMLENIANKLQSECGEKKALKRVHGEKKATMKREKKQHIKNGDGVQTQCAFQPHHNFPQQLHGNSSSTSLKQTSIQKPNQHHLTVDLKDGGNVFVPNTVGNHIGGDLIMNMEISHSTLVNNKKVLLNVKNKMKSRMLEEAERILQGSESQSVSLDKIYTELYIINDESDPVNREHEIWQIETSRDLNTSAQTVINYNQILHPLAGEHRPIKTVLTKGIAGIGKTITVQKFVLDWATGEANQDLELVFLLPFRELNLLEKETSLFNLLCDFYIEFKEAKPIPEWICERKVLIILDGLDEYKNDLNFRSCPLSDVTREASVDVLLENLLRGKLLPSAHLWITSRPVAAGQLPREIFKRGYITQIRGFRDEQKEEYFKKQLEDQTLAQDVIRHLKSQKSLWILCHIPLFCWISAVVLKDIIARQNKDGNMPSNLTQMYIHYLLIQTGLSHEKYQGQDLSQQDALQRHKEVIMRLAELAYWQLRAQSVIFREEDLNKYDITVDDAHQYPGVITCVTDYKFGYYRTKHFTFVHLSAQEFFAALFAFHTFLSRNQDSLNLKAAKKREESNLGDFLKDVVDLALQSKNGHLDLFICFLFGISCDSSRRTLEAVLPPLWTCSSDGHKKVTKYIKSLKREGLSPERCISLARCLFELKDAPFLVEILDFQPPYPHIQSLTVFQCSLLAFKFRMSDTKHEKFDLRKYNISLEGFQRLSPAITCFRKALLKGSGCTEQHCKRLMGYLRSPDSYLTHLDLSHNALGRSALEQLSPALHDPNCLIQSLNLSHNELQSPDMDLIRDVLSGDNVNLKELDLSDNPLGDSGVKALSDGLQSADCHLEVLKRNTVYEDTRRDGYLFDQVQEDVKELNSVFGPRLGRCQIIEGGYQLVSSLKASSSCLRELDLRYNDVGNLEQDILRISTGGICGRQPGLRKYAVTLTFDPQTANKLLHLTENNTVATRQTEQQPLPDNAERFDSCNQVLCRPPLSPRCFFTVDVIGLDVHVGVACGAIQRKGSSAQVRLGQNEMSWSLCCSKNKCVTYHNQTTESVQTESIRKLGVFLDREAGSLCFYSLSPQMKLLYMFDADFPRDQELFAAFRIQDPGGSAVLLDQTHWD